MKTLLLGLAALLVAAPSPQTVAVGQAPGPQDAARCSALAGRSFGDARIDGATATPAGTAWTSDAGGLSGAGSTPIAATHPFCRIRGTIEKEMRFELWLPLAGGWNGKLLGAGVGGDAGRFNYADLPRGVSHGYAAATTDTGHKAEDVDWMLGDPQRLLNYTHRANHLLAIAAKAIVADFYGSAPRHSYFIGCSGGGRQGLKEMQRYPDDYDGIVSGDGGPDTPAMTTRRMWELDQRDRHPGLMTAADWTLVSQAGVKACDAADGVTDGVAENPLQCRFDIASLLCKGAKVPGQCLDPQQVAFAKSFYAPLVDKNGQRIDDGLLPGVLVDSGRSQLALGTFGRAIRHQSHWDGTGFDLATDHAAIDRVMPELRADKADLSAFSSRGGKAILYSGWMDPAVAARMMTSYHARLVAAAGGETRADRFLRFYMLPGMFHCRGGPGPDNIGGAGADAPVVDPAHDLLSALDAWVEQGKAPGTIIASKTEQDGSKPDRVVRTRPICAFPHRARYRGHGSTDDAANFVCS